MIKDDNKESHTVTTRLDLKNRICLMAAIIYGTSDQDKMTVQKAVEFAVGIEDATEARVRKMKTNRPIPRAGSVKK